MLSGVSMDDKTAATCTLAIIAAKILIDKGMSNNKEERLQQMDDAADTAADIYASAMRAVQKI
jgi:hypothetical protein